jgi:hypothetical protein
MGKFITFNSYKQRNLSLALNNTIILILLGGFLVLGEILSKRFPKNIANKNN